MQYPYDPGNLPGSANECTHGKVHLRSNLSRSALGDVTPGFTTERLETLPAVRRTVDN